MAYTRTLTMTLYNRPDYLKKVLGALSRAAGIERYHIIFCIEPGCPEVIALAESVRFARTTVLVNEKVLTCPVNVYQAMSLAFLETDFNIHLEDDLLLAKDALLFFEHCRTHYAGDPEVLSVTAYNNQDCPPEKHACLARRRWFTPWAWATWKDRFETLKADWDFNYSHGNWDHNINSRLRGERAEVYPILARCQNIGVTGVHVPSKEWGEVFHYNEHWAGRLKTPPVREFVEDPGWSWAPRHLDPEVLARFPKAWLKAADMLPE